MPEEAALQQRGRVVIAIAAAVAAASSLAAAGAEAVRPVPPAPASWSRKVAGPNAYLPTTLPPGYRYTGWKNENTDDTELAERTLFLVTFGRGRARLVWTVSTLPSGDRCGARSAGDAKVGGKPVFWSGRRTAYDPPAGGAKGRHVWRCVASPDGTNRIKLDAFDEGGSLALPVVSRVVAGAANT